MNEVRFQVTGAKELEAVLKALGPAVARNVANNALRAGAKPIVDEARRLAPRKRRKGRGRIGRSITYQLFPLGTTYVALKIGVRRPWGSIAHLLEFGHLSKNQYGGPYGSVRPYPFLRPAFDTRATQALKRIIEVFRTGIEAQLRSVTKKVK